MAKIKFSKSDIDRMLENYRQARKLGLIKDSTAEENEAVFRKADDYFQNHQRLMGRPHFVRDAEGNQIRVVPSPGV